MEMALVELRGEKPVASSLIIQSALDSQGEGHSTVHGLVRGLLSAALLCARAGWTRASFLLWLTIIVLVVGSVRCRAPHTASPREAAAPSGRNVRRGDGWRRPQYRRLRPLLVSCSPFFKQGSNLSDSYINLAEKTEPCLSCETNLGSI